MEWNGYSFSIPFSSNSIPFKTPGIRPFRPSLSASSKLNSPLHSTRCRRSTSALLIISQPLHFPSTHPSTKPHSPHIHLSSQHQTKPHVPILGFQKFQIEIHTYVILLRFLIRYDFRSPFVDEERTRWSNDKMADCEVGCVNTRRKRGRKAEDTRVGEEEIVNRNGVLVDLVPLDIAFDPYGEELRRRTAGLVSEEDCLGFFRGLDGQ